MVSALTRGWFHIKYNQGDIGLGQESKHHPYIVVRNRIFNFVTPQKVVLGLVHGF